MVTFNCENYCVQNPAIRLYVYHDIDVSKMKDLYFETRRWC